MDFLKSEPEAAPYQLQAAATVARAAASGIGQPQRAMLDAMQQLVLETDLDIDTLKPIAPEELALHVHDPGQARQLIRLMVALSLADGPPSLSQVSLMSRFAKVLGVEEPSVKVIGHLAKGRLMRFRLAFFRRSHLRSYLRNTRRMLGGLLPVLKALLIARGAISEDSDRVSRYRALADLPEGTLGRHFYCHCMREGLAFPGQKGGFPVGAVFHDFAHVLGGYDTSPEGEMKNAAFQAGFTRDEDDFFTMLFALVIHTAGVNLAPFPMPVLCGRIGQGTLAIEVLHALQRGSAMKIDLGDGWKFWDYVELPIELAREQLGVLPLAPSLAASATP